MALCLNGWLQRRTNTEFLDAEMHDIDESGRDGNHGDGGGDSELIDINPRTCIPIPTSPSQICHCEGQECSTIIVARFATSAWV